MVSGGVLGTTALDAFPLAGCYWAERSLDAHAYGAGLIVGGDHGSPVTDLLVGRVSHKVVNLADCPVLVTR